jgi:hypothetical protein
LVPFLARNASPLPAPPSGRWLGGGTPVRKPYVHGLTRGDIFAFAHSRLAEHPRRVSNNFGDFKMQSLVNNITDRAQGVFLWVFLVTRSLRDGLTNGDTAEDLERRLASLPTDLERLFRAMLDAVDPMYDKKVAQTLSMAVNAREPLDSTIFVIHEYSYQNQEYALGYPIVVSTWDWDTLTEQCQRQVNARCGGLLEARNKKSGSCTEQCGTFSRLTRSAITWQPNVAVAFSLTFPHSRH